MTEILTFPNPNVDRELADTLKEMERLYLRFITFTDRRHAFACALWAASTFLFRATRCHGVKRTGYLAFVSPTEGCGKTTALTILGATCFGQPHPQVCSAPAAIFAQIDPRHLELKAADSEKIYHPRQTLILDELDGIAEDTDLVNLLNAGYMEKSYIYRRGGKNYQELIKYDIFSPKAFGYIRDSGSIRKIKSTLESRCIRILLRKQTVEQLNRGERYWDIEDAANPIVKKLLEWEMADDPRRVPESLIPLFKSRVLEPSDFESRERDIWDNLFAVAYLAGMLDEAHEVARSITEANREEVSDHYNPDIPVLLDLRAGLKDMQDEWGFATMIALKILRSRPDRDYNKIRRGHTAPWLTKEKLAIILRKYGVRSRQVGPKRVKRIDPMELKKVLDEVLAGVEDDEDENA